MTDPQNVRSRLGLALAEYERLLRRTGLDVDKLYAPGVPDDVTSSALSSIGLTAPAELLEWFGWHDGARLQADGKRRRECGPVRGLLSLEEALQERHWVYDPLCRGATTNVYWFPIMVFIHGAHLVVECNTAVSTEFCATTTMEGLDLREKEVRAQSLEAATNTWVRALATGLWYVEEPGGVFLEKMQPNMFRVI